jgi:hypothetical protein
VKILAFSDWQSQPLEMLLEIVKTERPHVILYAGDGLRRFIPIGKSILIKTQNHF